MAEHAWGPWVRALTECDKFYVVAIPDDGSEPVEIAVITNGVNAFEDTALIAAAPEMLAALEKVVWFHTDRGADETDFAVTFRQVQDAIAKATGTKGG